VELTNSTISNRPSLTATTSGAYGYFVQSARYHDIILSGNTITNVITGIGMNSSLAGGIINQFAGKLSINGNTIQSNLGGFYPGSGMYVLNGVSVNNMALSASATSTYFLDTAHVDNNIMHYVYNGIAANGYHLGQSITSDNNAITLNDRTGNPSAQNGILHMNCNASTIYNNTIVGPGFNIPVASSTPSLASKLTGIFGASNTNTSVSCNYTGHINIGFQFNGSANITHWLNNEMHENTYGMVVRGSFGEQGNATTPSNNVWRNSGTWWSAPNRNILTLNSGIPPDTIYVSANTSGTVPYTFDPLNNANNPAFITLTYGFGTSGVGNGLTIVPGNAVLPVCLSPYSPYLKTVKIATAPSAEGMAQSWIAQNSLWQMIQQDNSYADGSPTLELFASKAANNRLGWLTNIAAAIMSGDKATASSLLAMDIHAFVDTSIDSATGVIMRDGIEADYLVSNYLTMFNQYLKYQDSAMTGDDTAQVTTIANLCPYTNGNVVYLAQAMHRILFADDTTQFANTCGTDISDREAPAGQLAEQADQSYHLFPNPNDGSFVLKQHLNDAAPVAVTIKDMLGRSVFAGDIQFSNSTARLQLASLPAGVYLLQITASNKKISNFKFVVQK
jgi:hypothetical protein